MVFHGAEDSEASTPTRVRQFLKRGVVKFKEVSLLPQPVDATEPRADSSDHLSVMVLCVQVSVC